MKRVPVKMIKQEHKINEHTITAYYIVWNTTDNNTPITRVYARLHGGYGVVCYCPAHRYKKECYHKKLARDFVEHALTHTPDKRDT
jgi:hypothetical protein